jgi:hypothetical protein
MVRSLTETLETILVVNDTDTVLNLVAEILKNREFPCSSRQQRSSGRGACRRLFRQNRFTPFGCKNARDVRPGVGRRAENW